MYSDDVKATELENADFLRWLQRTKPGPVCPDDEDFDTHAAFGTTAEFADEYRLAQAKKLVRLFRQWRSEQKWPGPGG
jgi:hypothetical protein